MVQQTILGIEKMYLKKLTKEQKQSPAQFELWVAWQGYCKMASKILPHQIEYEQPYDKIDYGCLVKLFAIDGLKDISITPSILANGQDFPYILEHFIDPCTLPASQCIGI